MKEEINLIRKEKSVEQRPRQWWSKGDTDSVQGAKCLCGTAKSSFLLKNRTLLAFFPLLMIHKIHIFFLKEMNGIRELHRSFCLARLESVLLGSAFSWTWKKEFIFNIILKPSSIHQAKQISIFSLCRLWSVYYHLKDSGWFKKYAKSSTKLDWCNTLNAMSFKISSSSSLSHHLPKKERNLNKGLIKTSKNRRIALNETGWLLVREIPENESYYVVVYDANGFAEKKNKIRTIRKIFSQRFTQSESWKRN